MFRKILVPLDGSPSSIEGLVHAVMLAEDPGADLEVLHVEAPDDFAIGSTTPMAPAAREEAEQAMRDAVAAADQQLPGRVRFQNVHGDPVRVILETAAGGGIDLVVIGTAGRVGRMHALVGSLAEEIVRNAPCPVLTVRRATGEEESFAERLHHRRAILE
jgi:nucleotide-binding universal stress UspA family protein